MSNEGELFGRGFAFPPRVGADGRIAWSEGPDNVRQSIRVILMTEPRERVMLPEFGGGLRQYLFQPNVASTHRLIEEAITLALGRYEPRIRLDDVEVRADPDDDRAALARIRYTLVATHAKEEMRLRLVTAA